MNVICVCSFDLLALDAGLWTSAIYSDPVLLWVGINGGGGGIRTPGELPHNGFQDRRLRPLGHSSAISEDLDGPQKLICVGVSEYGGIGVFSNTLSVTPTA